MFAQVEKPKENKNQSVANGESRMQSSSESAFQFVDNRFVAIAQRKLQEMAHSGSSPMSPLIPKKETPEVIQLQELKLGSGAPYYPIKMTTHCLSTSKEY